MKTISVLLYEVDLNEIAKLPSYYSVLQYDTKYGFHTLKETGKDSFPSSPRFKFFLFQEPPLPKISEEYIITGETNDQKERAEA